MTGCFLDASRDFNRALDDYCSFVGLPEGLLQNVTDGTNAFLVALDRRGRVLASEAAIVDATRRNQIEEIFLVDRWVGDEERERLNAAGRKAILSYFHERAQEVPLNPIVEDRIREADLVLYAPGTQHSSLFPSYMTPGLGEALDELVGGALQLRRAWVDVDAVDALLIIVFNEAFVDQLTQGVLHERQVRRLLNEV